MSNFSKIRVVWNLTNRCPFNCPMCVASANKRKEKDINKNLLLDSILSFGKENVTIDFSGGDPLFIKEDIELVKKASRILGKDNVSISSTGLSLSKLSDDEILSLAGGYDMTYDFPKQYSEQDIRDKRYNSINFEQCIRLQKLGINVEIFIPIRNIDDIYFEQLAKDICKINPTSVNLLKCMPLNNLFDTDKIDSVDKTMFFKSLLVKLGYKGEIGINCALKEDFKECNNCNMLTERKVGLDQFGNLYTCIWASDLLIDKNENPFYLGNLFECSLFEILNSREVQARLNELNKDRNKCYVLDYYNKLKNKE